MTKKVPCSCLLVCVANRKEHSTNVPNLFRIQLHSDRCAVHLHCCTALNCRSEHGMMLHTMMLHAMMLHMEMLHAMMLHMEMLHARMLDAMMLNARLSWWTCGRVVLALHHTAKLTVNPGSTRMVLVSRLKSG